MARHRPTVLAIGGLDPSGGAGIAVDAAAIRFAEAHPATAMAVSTAQNGSSFSWARPVGADALSAAVEGVLADGNVRAVKIGALGNAANVEAIVKFAKQSGFPPIVVDPVLASTTGGALIDAEGTDALKSLLLPLAACVTPNLAEAAALTGEVVSTVAAMTLAGQRLVALGCGAALVKGGHLPGDRAIDVLVRRGNDAREYGGPRLGVGEVRGTGCALASLIAAHLALGHELEMAVVRSRAKLRAALAASYEIGRGSRALCLERGRRPEHR